jgi:hypothetical protein
VVALHAGLLARMVATCCSTAPWLPACPASTSRVDWEANEGVRISAICRYVTERLGHDSDHDNGNELLEELKSAMAHGGDVISLQQGLTAEPLRGLATGVAQRQPPLSAPPAALTPGAVLDLPLRADSLATTVSGVGQVAWRRPTSSSAFAEKYVSPRIDATTPTGAGSIRSSSGARSACPG